MSTISTNSRRRQVFPGTAALLTLILAAVLLLGFAGSAAAAENGVCGTLTVPDASGAVGTVADPCLITSDDDLDTAQAAVNSDTPVGASSANYELTTNLEYATDSTTGNATIGGITYGEWKGFGTSSDLFEGTFDGDGHTISNLDYTAASDQGLFADTNLATVENLTLDNVTNSGTSQNVGGVIAQSYASTVKDVSVLNPTLTGTNVGGLVAYPWSNTAATANDAGDKFTESTGACYYGSSASENPDLQYVTDGHTAQVVDDSVIGGTLTGVPGSTTSSIGGLGGSVRGVAVFDDDYVDTSLVQTEAKANVAKDTAALAVGYGGPSMCNEEGEAIPVQIDDDVLDGSITSDATSTNQESKSSINYFSAVMGYSAPELTAASNYGNWEETNVLVNSGATFSSNISGTPVAGGTGTVVSPSVLQTQSFYTDPTSATETDPEDSATKFTGLGWDFTTPSWLWAGSGATAQPVVPETPDVSLANGSVTLPQEADASAETLVTGADPTLEFANSVLDGAGVSWSESGTIDWATPGSYEVTLTGTGSWFSVTAPLTVVVTQPFNSITLGKATYALEETTGTLTQEEVLAGLQASDPEGDGALAVDLDECATDECVGGPFAGDQAVDFDTPGTYQVTVYDTDEAGGVKPVKAEIRVDPKPVISLGTGSAIVYFNSADPPTAESVLSGAAITLMGGASTVPGTFVVTIPAEAEGGVAGAYDVTVVGSDSDGFESAPVTVSIHVSDSALTVSNTDPVFQATAGTVTEASVTAALGASIRNPTDGTPQIIGWSTVEFDTPGEYPVQVGDSEPNDVVAPVSTDIEVVPVTVLSATAQTVHYNVTSPPTVDEIKQAAGVELTDGAGHAVSGELSASVPAAALAGTAGEYQATISGTDFYGFTTNSVTVEVDVSDAAVATTGTTAVFEAHAEAANDPSSSAVASALGASLTGSVKGGTVTADTSSVDWGVPGEYEVTVYDSDQDDEANIATATVKVVPDPVLSVPHTTVQIPVSGEASLSEALLLSVTGAELTDGSGNPIAGTVSVDCSQVVPAVAGSYTATITAEDSYGIAAPPITVTVEIITPTLTAGTVSLSGTAAVGQTLTATTSGWLPSTSFGYRWFLDGVEDPSAQGPTFTVDSADAGDTITVKVTGSAQYYASSSVISGPVTVPASSEGDVGEAGAGNGGEEPGNGGGGNANAGSGPGGPASAGEPSHPSSGTGAGPIGAGSGTPPKPPTVLGDTYESGTLELKLRVNAEGTLTTKVTIKQGKKSVTIGSSKTKVEKAGSLPVRVKLTKADAAKLKRSGETVTVTITFKSATGKTVTETKTLKIK
jgi:hypothetical protein